MPIWHQLHVCCTFEIQLLCKNGAKLRFCLGAGHMCVCPPKRAATVSLGPPTAPLNQHLLMLVEICLNLVDTHDPSSVRPGTDLLHGSATDLTVQQTPISVERGPQIYSTPLSDDQPNMRSLCLFSSSWRDWYPRANLIAHLRVDGVVSRRLISRSGNDPAGSRSCAAAHANSSIADPPAPRTLPACREASEL